MVELGGWTEPAFEPVVRAFVENFEKRRDVGSACSVYVDGQPVVDIWGGVADLSVEAVVAGHAGGRVLDHEGAIAICAHMLVQRGRSTSTPRRATGPSSPPQAERITVRQVLGHAPGLRTSKVTSPRRGTCWDRSSTRCRAKPNGNRARRTATTCDRWMDCRRDHPPADGRSPTILRRRDRAAIGSDFWIGLPSRKSARRPWCRSSRRPIRSPRWSSS